MQKKFLSFLVFMLASTHFLIESMFSSEGQVYAHQLPPNHVNLVKAIEKCDIQAFEGEYRAHDRMPKDEINEEIGSWFTSLPALHRALKIKTPSTEFVQYLLSQDADPNKIVYNVLINPFTPLEYIADSSHLSDEDSVAFAKLLLNAGAKIFFCDIDEKESSRLVRILGLDQANKRKKNKLANFLKTTAQDLIEKERLSSDRVPYSTYKKIVESRIQKNSEKLNFPINFQNKTLALYHCLYKDQLHDNCSLLTRCIVEHYNDLAAQLVEHQPRLITKVKSKEATPLMWSVIFNNAELCTLFLNKGSNPNHIFTNYSLNETNFDCVKIKGTIRASALQIAVAKGLPHIVQILLEHKADKNSVNEEFISYFNLNDKVQQCIDIIHHS